MRRPIQKLLLSLLSFLLISIFSPIYLASTTTEQGIDGALLAIIHEHRGQSDRCFDHTTQSWAPWEGPANRQLALASSLNQAAAYHSQFMADHDCFAHQCPGEPDLPARLAQFGYTEWTAYGENLAAGVETPEAIFELWKNSPPHNRNMLICQFEELGVSRVFDSSDEYPSAQAPWQWYWTAIFGSHQ